MNGVHRTKYGNPAYAAHSRALTTALDATGRLSSPTLYCGTVRDGHLRRRQPIRERHRACPLRDILDLQSEHIGTLLSPTHLGPCPVSKQAVPLPWCSTTASADAQERLLLLQRQVAALGRGRRDFGACLASTLFNRSLMSVRDKITDAQKTTLHSNTPYITYVIHAGVSTSHGIADRVSDIVLQQTAEARHRYSEFESLRLNLVRLYPTLIIPPIPSKQTIGDYATKQAKAKEDAVMIARRKRMLQTFLNRIARHPILSNEHIFHRFLEGEVSWVGQVPVFC